MATNPADPAQLIQGICVAENACAATTFVDETGKTVDIKKIGGIVGDIFKGVSGLLQNRNLNDIGGLPGGDAFGCTEYYTTSVVTSDPCAQYVPPDSTGGGGGSSIADDLLDALGGGGSSSSIQFGTGTTSGSTGNQLLDLILHNTSNSSTTFVNPLQNSSATFQNSLLSQTVSLSPGGTHGDIQITGTGGTILAGSRDTVSGTEVAGFYGGDTSSFGGEPQGVIANLCRNRPWAGSFISYVIPPTFFDGLCSWRGYQVGIPAAQDPTLPTQQPTTFTAPVFIPATTTAPVAQSKVDIWAVPSTVALGARTSIFWNSQGVASCTVRSSDGSFTESSTSGGAATVPITDRTTFTITCITPNG